MYQTILFDVDGTLLDTRQSMADAYRYAVGEMGLFEEDYSTIYAYVGISTSGIFRDRHSLDGEEFQKARSLYYGHFLEVGLKNSPLFPGVGDLLHELKRTNKTIAVATAREQYQCELMLSSAGIPDLFDYVGTMPPGSALGDKDDLLRRCMAAMDVGPEGCVMIGDRKYDINGAAKVGMDSIAVTYGFGTEREMSEECSPTHIAHSAHGVAKLLLERA